jgi:hypothetical protein
LRQEVDPHAIRATVAAATSLGRLDMLRLWIEAQSTPIIALVVFGLSYLGTALIFVLVTSAAPHGWARDFKFIPAVALTPLVILLAVLLGFLASRVWANFDHAEGYVRQKADALHQTLLMAQALPPNIQTRLRNAISAHVKAVEEEEWPAMARQQQANLARSPGVRCIDGGDRDAAGVRSHPDGRAGGARARRGGARAGTRGKAKQDHAERCADRLAPVVGRGSPHRAGPGDDRDVAYRQPRSLRPFFVLRRHRFAASLLLLMAYDQPFSAGGFFLRPTLLREIVAN